MKEKHQMLSESQKKTDLENLDVIMQHAKRKAYQTVEVRELLKSMKEYKETNK